MAKFQQGELYERTVAGKTEYRTAPHALNTSKVARAMWAAQGWSKSAGGTPVGVAPAKPKGKPKQEEESTEA